MSLTWRACALTAEQSTSVTADPGTAATLVDDAGLDLGQLWHGLNWLLVRGVDVPAEDAIMGGHELSKSARLLDPGRVASLAAELDSIGEDELRDTFDPDHMLDASIYPPIWGEPNVLDTKVMPAFEKLSDFYSAAAADNRAVLIVIG